ncbi:hypothetical protein NUW58_g312 [Xylaria curta]|uniref:Uncharacterized protein n=2 Tax=Xylaria curta TaxID=42375 RepID=A0ACC1PPP9_9PEZI|nr:hypothetical protein NUW58_g3732 [Xylaria curta]KAJ2998455.1 hypothetical protein NUW58_g312 [Xylaria curta]
MGNSVCPLNYKWLVKTFMLPNAVTHVLSSEILFLNADMNETLPFPLSFLSLEEDWSANPVPYLLGIVLDEYRKSAKTMLQDARKQYPNRPYRMTTEFGEVVMLQSELFDEVRNNPNLSFFGTVAQERIGEIPGFEPVAAIGHDGDLVKIIARKQLTKALSQVSTPLSEEAADAVLINLGEPTEWREIAITPVLLDLTARMSSRVFLGEELAKDEEWLKITKTYTVDVTKGIIQLSRYPVNLRPYIGWLFPECRRVREYYTRGRNVIEPVMRKREEMTRAALAAGKPAPVFNDALGWMVQESKELGKEYDVVTFQLILSVVAINTTTDLLQSVLIDLIQHPDTMQAVRDEMVHVLKQDGWKKSALYNMKLLDSVIKETQRIRPIFMAMRRSVEADTVLSDGTVVKKGSRIHIDTHRMVDPHVYESPEEWKGNRFLEMRSQPGKENLAQLVTTNVDHFGFGHGLHACPGRFFAANELKISLCHLLIKYDWELAPETDTNVMRVGFSQRANPTTKVLFRKRTAELDIDSI